MREENCSLEVSVLLLLTYLENYDLTLCGFPHRNTAAEGSKTGPLSTESEMCYIYICMPLNNIISKPCKALSLLYLAHYTPPPTPLFFPHGIAIMRKDSLFSSEIKIQIAFYNLTIIVWFFKNKTDKLPSLFKMGSYLLVTAVKMLLKIDIVSTTKKLSAPVNHKQKTNEVSTEFVENLWASCMYRERCFILPAAISVCITGEREGIKCLVLRQ